MTILGIIGADHLRKMTSKFGIKLAVTCLSLVVVAAIDDLEEELKNAQSDQVRQYLQQFEQFLSQQSGKDKTAMETVELLVIQSWLYSLAPTDRNLEGLTGVARVDKGRPLHEGLVDLIKGKSEGVVADDVLHYTEVDGLFDQLRKNLESKKDDLNTRINSAGDIDTDDLEDEDNEADSILGMHDVALNMAAQSFVMDFMAKPAPGIVTIKSSDGTKKRDFYVATLEEGDFLGIMDDPLLAL